MFSSLRIFLLILPPPAQFVPRWPPAPRCTFLLPPRQTFPPWRGLFWLAAWGFLYTYATCVQYLLLLPCQHSSPAQQTDLLSGPWHFLRILILALITLSLAVCMNACRVHPKPSLLRAEVVLSLSVTQTATWKMHMPSHFSRAWPCDPMNCSLPGSSVHGILQAEILEWVALPSFRGSSRPRDRTCISYVSCIGRQVLYLSRHLGQWLSNARTNIFWP